jgi:hypothetical protein
MALASVMAVCYKLSALLLGKSSAFTPKMFLGCGLAIAGFAIEDFAFQRSSAAGQGFRLGA